MSAHFTVYRTTSTYGRASGTPSISHAWWVTAEYDWGTVNTLCQSWRGAMNHANREIAYMARKAVAA